MLKKINYRKSDEICLRITNKSAKFLTSLLIYKIFKINKKSKKLFINLTKDNLFEINKKYKKHMFLVNRLLRYSFKRKRPYKKYKIYSENMPYVRSKRYRMYKKMHNRKSKVYVGRQKGKTKRFRKYDVNRWSFNAHFATGIYKKRLGLVFDFLDVPTKNKEFYSNVMSSNRFRFEPLVGNLVRRGRLIRRLTNRLYRKYYFLQKEFFFLKLSQFYLNYSKLKSTFKKIYKKLKHWDVESFRIRQRKVSKRFKQLFDSLVVKVVPYLDTGTSFLKSIFLKKLVRFLVWNPKFYLSKLKLQDWKLQFLLEMYSYFYRDIGVMELYLFFTKYIKRSERFKLYLESKGRGHEFVDYKELRRKRYMAKKFGKRYTGKVYFGSVILRLKRSNLFLTFIDDKSRDVVVTMTAGRYTRVHKELEGIPSIKRKLKMERLGLKSMVRRFILRVRQLGYRAVTIIFKSKIFWYGRVIKRALRRYQMYLSGVRYKHPLPYHSGRRGFKLRRL